VDRIHWKMIENGYEKLQLVKFYWEQDIGEEGLISIQHISFIVASLYQWTRAGVQTYIGANMDLNRVKAVLQQWVASLGDQAVSGSDLRSILPSLIQSLP